jgi:hypothetical protein
MTGPRKLLLDQALLIPTIGIAFATFGLCAGKIADIFGPIGAG